MSTYLQSLASHLHDKSLLTNELKAALLKQDNEFSSKPLMKMPYGAHCGKTLREI